MSIIIGTVVTWIAITVFSFIPKKLTPIEIILLFCIDTIFELSVFSILHVNLNYIVVNPGVSNGIADLMFRLIEVPLLLVATSNILLYANNILKWCGVAAIVVFTMIVQQILVSIGMITFHHWNVLYSGITICAAVVFSRITTWIITSLDTKEAA